MSNVLQYRLHPSPRQPVQSPNSTNHYTEPASPALWPHTCPFIPSPASEVSKQLPSRYAGRLGPASHTKAKPISISHVHPDSFSSECLDTCPPGSRLPPVSNSHSCFTGPEASSLSAGRGLHLPRCPRYSHHLLKSLCTADCQAVLYPVLGSTEPQKTGPSSIC